MACCDEIVLMEEEEVNIDEAYAEMKKRGWGFCWDFSAGIIAIGPLRDGLVQVIAVASDPSEAVQKAIDIVDNEKKTGHC